MAAGKDVVRGHAAARRPLEVGPLPSHPARSPAHGASAAGRVCARSPMASTLLSARWSGLSRVLAEEKAACSLEHAAVGACYPLQGLVGHHCAHLPAMHAHRRLCCLFASLQPCALASRLGSHGRSLSLLTVEWEVEK
jgi:hypothetical protein